MVMTRRRSRAHGISRVRARPRRHAHAGRRPGAQDLDHSARPGARRDALDARDGSLQLPREELVAKIKVALGGRAAEKVVYDEITTGAESDIQNLTQIARGMVGRWGMSDAIGPIAVTDGRRDGMLVPGAEPASAADTGAGRRGGAAHRRGGRARCRRLLDASAHARRARPGAAGAGDARPGRRLRGRRRRPAQGRPCRGGQGQRGPRLGSSYR